MVWFIFVDDVDSDCGLCIVVVIGVFEFVYEWSVDMCGFWVIVLIDKEVGGGVIVWVRDFFKWENVFGFFGDCIIVV